MPALAPHATNAHQVTVAPLDFNHEHAPTVQTYHGLSISVNDKITGRVVSWNPQAYQRDANHIYELNHRTAGRPVDIVPGASRGYTIAATRNEMWDNEIEVAWGEEQVYDDLADQVHPHTVDEFLFKGSALYRMWRYTGCWFTDRNVEGFSADGDFTVRISANLMYVSRRRLR